jgi:ABC-type transport system substrate-binding protein
MGLRELLLILLVCYATAQEKTRLVIAPTTQSGGFLHGHDVGPMNPHSYRPNEFFANDFVFEGLVAWNSSSLGVDAKKGTLDDGVVPALAASWTTTATDSGMEITFKLTPDVTFHDGEKWDAAAAVINFDHIMGCKGGCIGEKKASRGGFHDWWGLGGAIKSWSAVDEMTFKLTFKHYYEAALRELSTIRPFRMASPKVLPDMNQGLLSCNEWKKGAPRVHKEFTCNGVKAPIGTGPYKVVEKIISDGSATPKTRSIAADKFHESCWAAADPNKSCKYNAGEFVAEVHFEKHVGHRAFKNEGGKKAFDAVIARSYKNQLAVQASLLDGSLDMVYGVGALPPSVFLRLSTSEGGELVSHRASHVINTRSIVLNSIGALNTPEKRKAVMGVIDRQPLIDGELAEEKPADTLFDPEMPYCKDSVNLKSIKELAAEAPASAKASLQTTANVKPLKFIYKKDIPHESIIASKIIADLYIAGISVEPLVLSKGDYNAAMNSWLGADGEALSADDANATTPIYCATNPPVSGTLGCISFGTRTHHYLLPHSRHLTVML